MFALIPAAALALAAPAASAPSQVKVGEPPARMALLTPGVHRYVRYTVKDGVRATTDLWVREVRFEPLNGKRQLHIIQRWDRVVPPTYVKQQDSWFDARTLAPLTHVNRVTREGAAESVGGYRFEAGRVTGLADLPGNTRKDFSQAAPEAPFNFETDMELFQVLPWRAGWSVSLPFYDPGLEPPARYVFTVTGSAMRPGPDGRPIDCWLVETVYAAGKPPLRIWIAKRNQLVVHEETERDGTLYVKTLLGAEAADRG